MLTNIRLNHDESTGVQKRHDTKRFKLQLSEREEHGMANGKWQKSGGVAKHATKNLYAFTSR